MKAVGYTKSLPVDDDACLEDVEIDDPIPGPRDLLVEVRAVSVNPVDAKVRMRAEPEGGYKVLGYDAAGVVRSVGAEASLFAPGDEVWYAGDVTRPGTNAELHVVDERIVGHKPSSIDFAAAAALPLTAITAWEMLFDCFGLDDADDGTGEGETLLVIGGAGGVGSILIQLAKALTSLTVVATASREDTIAWCREMGADHVIDHHGSLPEQLGKLGLTPRYVAALTASGQHFDAIVELIAPRGQIAMIDDPGEGVIEVTKLKGKALSFHWELMFVRPMFETDDMIVQNELLDRVAELVDAGTVKSTANRDGGTITAANLREAHRHQESGKAIGKTVLAGF